MVYEQKDPQQNRFGRAPNPKKRKAEADEERRPDTPPPDKATTHAALMTPVAPLALAGLAVAAIAEVSKASGTVAVKDYDQPGYEDAPYDASAHEGRVRQMEEQRRREAEARRRSLDSKVREMEAKREEMLRLTEEVRARVESRLTTLRSKYTTPPVGVTRRIESLNIESSALSNLHVSLHAISGQEVSEWPERVKRALSEAERDILRMDAGEERVDARKDFRAIQMSWLSKDEA